MLYRFESITRKRSISMTCAAGCGRRVTRVVSNTETISPFNLVPDGSRPKSRDEVIASVRAGLDAKCEVALVCRSCGEAVGLKP